MSRDGIATKLASDNSEQKKRAVSLLYRVDSVLRLDGDPFISLDSPGYSTFSCIATSTVAFFAARSSRYLCMPNLKKGASRSVS